LLNRPGFTDRALVQIGHLSVFYKRALEKKNITGVFTAYFEIFQCKLLSTKTAQTCILVWD